MSPNLHAGRVQVRLPAAVIRIKVRCGGVIPDGSGRTFQRAP